MKTLINTAVAGALALGAAAVQAEPTRLFTQEMGDVAAKDAFSADFNYGFAANGLTGGLRAGAFGGEVLLNNKNLYNLDISGLAVTNLGYKFPLGKGMAVYGLISNYGEDVGGVSDSWTDFGLGFAYTYRSGDLTLNVNPELITNEDPNIAAARGAENTIFIRGGVAYALPVKTSGKISLVGELVLEDNDALDTTLNLGARWEPRKDVTIDFVIYNDTGDTNGTYQGIPGAVTVNVAF